MHAAGRQLDPGLQDAYFGIGLYHYYADVAPTAALELNALKMSNLGMMRAWPN